MKYFIVSDVHGYYDKMIEALNKAGYDKNNPEHIFVSLGDLLDRGRQPYECISFVNSLPKERKILIRGNHETLLNDAAWRECFEWNDFPNGTSQTVRDLYNHENAAISGEGFNYADETQNGYKNQEETLRWLRHWGPYKQYHYSTVPYAVVGDNIFVHGWVPNETKCKADLEKFHTTQWEHAAWRNGMQAYYWCGPVYKTEEDFQEEWDINDNIDTSTICTVFCGHYHTSWWRKHITHEQASSIPRDEEWDEMTAEERANWFRPVIRPGLVALDACTAYSGIINCYVLET